jgi:7-alpha-hydroxysteroid dehydrogenase
MSTSLENPLSLAGKAAVVTGGSNGLGRAISQLLVANGVSVLVADIDRAAGQALCVSLNRTEKCAAFALCDVTVPSTIRAAIDACVSSFGRFDIMLNNAGGFRSGSLHSATS